jgi:ribosomal protein S18 acetylase RimI-like enzyme
MFRRLLSPAAKPAVQFQARLLGPAYDQLDRGPDGPSAPGPAGGRIRLREGPSAGQEFQLTFEASDREAHVHLRRDGEEFGHCDFERDAPEANVVLWYIWVTEALRRHGLASIMARYGLRQMLERHKSASYAIRMLRLISPGERITKIRNVGIAVLSRKLGLASEYDLESLLTEGNVQAIELIDADEDTPPGYRIVLKDLPYVLIVFLVDPENGRPYPGGHRIYNSLVSPEAARRWLAERMIVIGNGNYVLRQDGIAEMVNHLADDAEEARVFAGRIRPVPRA